MKIKNKNQFETVIFTHIPKASGTTLIAALKREYKKEYMFKIDNEAAEESVEYLKKLSNERKRKIHLIHGHWPVGLHRYMPGMYTYITMLRDPVDRVISHYYHVLRNPDHYAYQRGFNRKMSLKDYILSGVVKGETHNGQTWFLTGGKYDDFEKNCNEVMEMAKNSIKKYFSFVGLTERFDESLLLFQKVLGWKNLPLYYRRHVSGNRLPKNKINPDLINMIREHNKIDMEIYQYVEEVFNERLRNEGKQFLKDLRNFRIRNDIYEKYINMRKFAGTCRRKILKYH